MTNNTLDFASLLWFGGCNRSHGSLQDIGVNLYSRAAVVMYSDQNLIQSIVESRDCKCNLVFLNPCLPDAVLMQQISSCEYVFSDWTKEEAAAYRLAHLLDCGTYHVYRTMPQASIRNDSTDSFIFYTSGSTGKPKEIYRKREVCYAEAKALAEKLHIMRDDLLLFLAPCYHVYGQSLSLAAMFAGAKVSYMSPMSPEDKILRELRKENYSIFVGTPYCYNRMYQELKEISTVRFFINAGGAVSAAARDSGLPIYNQYGSTETGAVSVRADICSNSANDVGTPLPDVKVLAEEPFFPEKNLYRIRVDTPYLAYKMIEDEQEKRLESPFLTNDIGWVDKDGHIHLAGRTDGVINYYGEKFFAEEVEAVLKKHPAVERALVKKAADAQTEFAIAYIVENYSFGYKKAEGKTGIEINHLWDELTAFCTGYLPPCKIPKKFFFVDSLEQNTLGKIIVKEEMVER